MEKDHGKESYRCSLPTLVRPTPKIILIAICDNATTNGRYVHNDTFPSFKGFRPFGGWTKPEMKQYLLLWNSGGTHLDFSLSRNATVNCD